MIEERTKHDIDKLVEQLLWDIYALEPPLELKDVLDHLNLHRGYYSLDDPSLLKEIEHKIKIGAQIGLKKIKKIFKKVAIRAITIPDDQKILIDESIPNVKKRWAESHEICHNLIPTHKYFLFGDIPETLDPDYHEMLEAEANYGASSLIFLGDLFSKESLDLSDEWKSVSVLAKRYGNSLTSTLRRYVQFSQDTPKVGFFHTPIWMSKPDDQVTRCRYFVKSKRFEEEFSGVNSNDIIDAVDSYIHRRKGGPVGEDTFQLCDDNGVNHEFTGYSFFNQHYIMTLISYNGPKLDLF